MATEFKRSGYTDEEAADLAQVASLYQNVADEELSAADASAVLISQMKAFQNQGLSAIQIIDAINEVAARNAVSTSDIGRGLTQAGAALSTYGNTYYETIALLTAGTEIFQGRSQQVARGLNTVASRVVKNEKALAEYGVQIYDTNGDLKSTYQILSELAPEWEKMSNAEQVALGTTLAGVNQYKVFAAVMGNFDTAVKVVTKDIEHFDNSALRQNERYMESVKAKTQQLKAEVQKLVLEENVMQNLFKAIVSFGTKIVKFFNTFEGKVVLVSIAVITLIANFEKLKIVFTGYFATFLKVIRAATESIYGFTAGAMSASEALKWFKANLDALNLNPYMLLISAIIALLASLVIVFRQASVAVDEHKKKLEEHKQAIKDGNDKIAEYKSRLQEIANEIDTINKKDLNTDKNAKRNIRNLKSEQVELERLINLQRTLNKEEQKKKNEEAVKIFGSLAQRVSFFNAEKSKQNKMASIRDNDYAFLVGGGYMSQERYNELIKGAGGVNQQYYMPEGLEIATAKLKAYSDEFDKLYAKKEASKHGGVIWTPEDEEAMKKEQDNLSAASSEASYLASTLQEAYDSADSSVIGYDKVGKALEEYYGTVETAGKATKDLIGINDAEEESIDEQIQAWEELQEEIVNLAQSLGISTYQLDKFRNTFGDDEKLKKFLVLLNEIKTELDNASASIDNIQTAYENAKQAQEEFNESGTLSLDTFQSLLSISTEYLSSLINEKGQIEMNDAVMEDLIGTMKRAKIEEIQQTAAVDVMNYVLGNTENMSQLAKDAIDNMKTSVENEGNATVIAAKQNLDFSASVLTIAKATGSLTDEEINKRKAGVSAIIKSYEEMANMINNIAVDTEKTNEKNTKSNDDYNSSLKETNSLLQQQKQELEEKKKQYDTVVSYIKKKIQGEIDKLKDQKKAEVDAIKDKIDAIKDEKEAESDRIDEQIKKLKEQQEVEEEYWQKKIDALKEQNDELETQLEYEELLEDLAKAKSKRVRVYEEGKGFVYKEDTNEVDKAQSKLDEFNRKQSYEKQLKELEEFKEKSKENYEKQIEDLEKLKEQKEKNYDEQIKKLEEQQKAIEEKYDAQIKYFQDYLDKFTEQTDAYENQQNRLLALQLTGIDFEAQGWQTRLDNLADFVEKYNALLGDIHTLDSVVDTSDTNNDKTPKTEDNLDKKEKEKREAVDKIKDSTKKYVINNRDLSEKIKQQKTAEWYKKNYGGKKASGDSYIKDDGVYLVGDNPNQELVIGSKLNGSLVNLSKGAGVVNATSTNTLAGILNQLGAMGSNIVNTSNTNNRNTTISIGNISLPNVSNGNDFVDYLQNFSLQMTQEAFA